MSGLVERRPVPRCGFRGKCCQPTPLHRLCRQPNGKMRIVDAAGHSSTEFESGNIVSYEKFGADG